MYCPNCGSYNEDDAVFCGSCGTRLAQGEEVRPEYQENDVFQEHGVAQEVQEPAEEAQENTMPPSPAKKKGKKVWFILAAVLVVAAAAAAAVFLLILPQQKEKRYTALVDEGNRYLEEMDYEKAEDAFLKAIAVEPKEAEPYVKLTDIYLDNGEREKAKEIIADAKKNLPKESKKEIEKLEEERRDELNGEETVYTWAVEPEIEADDIYYLKETGIRNYPLNEMERQMFTDYAVIKRGDSYGLIDMDGEILDGMDYIEVTSGSGYYMLKTEEPVYIPEYGWEMDSFYLYEDEIIPAIGVEGDAYGFKGAFYYCDGLQNIFDAYGEDAFGPRTWTDPEDGIPVKKSDTILKEISGNGVQDWSAWLDELPGGYGIYFGNDMITDFIYEACGSSSSGLLAVQQEGKWGYVDNEGNIVIPIEYDASWTQYVPQNGKEEQDYCYAAAEGYVVLVKDGVWEIRDVHNEPVIDPGVFEEIRPVYDGKCWVKQDGRWGVIILSGADSTEAAADKKEEETGLSAESSAEEVRDAVLEHLNDNLGESGGSYSIFDSETTETDTEYNFLIRYSIPEEEAEKSIANGGMPAANRLAGLVTVERTKGTATFEFSTGGQDVWQLWENEDSAGNGAGDEDGAQGFSADELRSIATSLRVPENADVDIRVEGDPYYWEAGGRWLVSVTVYQGDKYVAGAAVDRDTREIVRDIYTYSP